jgi:hypothetical protein
MTTALGIAARRLDLPLIELLLKHGANPQALDLDRRTAAELLPPRGAENAQAWDAAARVLSRTTEE